MSKIIRVLIQNYLHQNKNKNREEVKNREIRYLPDLSIFNLISVDVLVQRILNYYPNYPTNHLYFGEVETPYCIRYALFLSFPILYNFDGFQKGSKFSFKYLILDIIGNY